ncbi:hypothetical protein SAMN06264855_1344 [Halorubrum vacuolatum]|uniref:Uncharacterized protein n=1 Tax=Halorubrum vacuolatum TaxID=63740 RepID=A0A238Y8F8_HALVU|nr:hypothetical protein SAMN06264855_1344 [Halorubrum vacuolatum]
MTRCIENCISSRLTNSIGEKLKCWLRRYYNRVTAIPTVADVMTDVDNTQDTE